MPYRCNACGMQLYKGLKQLQIVFDTVWVSWEYTEARCEIGYRERAISSAIEAPYLPYDVTEDQVKMYLTFQ
jgi:hypothetical protein